MAGWLSAVCSGGRRRSHAAVVLRWTPLRREVEDKVRLEIPELLVASIGSGCVPMRRIKAESNGELGSA
jgi:hypothetical protein